MANVNLQERKFKTAEGLLKKCLKLEPKFSTAWMNLGIAYMGQKQFTVLFLLLSTEKKSSIDCLLKCAIYFLHDYEIHE